MVSEVQAASLAPQRRPSSFRLAMQILPAPRRDAMFALYAFCRAVDDIADGDLAPAAKRAALEGWRAAVDHCYAGVPPARMMARAGILLRHALA